MKLQVDAENGSAEELPLLRRRIYRHPVSVNELAATLSKTEDPHRLAGIKVIELGPQQTPGVSSGGS